MHNIANRFIALVLGTAALGSEPARADEPSVIEIVVEGGYHPSRIEVPEGRPVRLRFLRRDHSSCTREVVLAWLGIRRELPTGRPVVIELPPMRAGEYEFRCGMNMLRGTIVVKPR